MKDSTSVFGRIGAYYDRLVERYGHDPRAADYGRPESQQAKFRVLSEVLDDRGGLNGKRVLDVGCGFADFADYLSRRYPEVQYTGVDLSAAMVREAQRLHPQLAIRRLNVLFEDPGQFDVVVANGIFYLLGEDAANLMDRLVRRMFDLAREAIAFNALSTWAPSREPNEFYADPVATLAMAGRLSPSIALRHDYHARDFTVFVYRRGP